MMRLLGLGEGEVPRSLRLVSLIFVSSMALVLLKAAQRGIFLCAYPSTAIPWAFAASAIVLASLSAVAVMAAGRLGPARLAITTLVASAAASLALRALLATGLHAAPFALYVVVEAIAGLVLIQTWSVVAGTVDPRSARRLLPLAGVGAGVAWTLGGMFVAPLVDRIGAPGLLVAAPILLLGSAVLVRRIARLDVAASSLRPGRAANAGLLEGWRRGLAFSFAVPLMRLSMIVSVLALLGEQLMDFQILASAHDRFASEADTTNFFGRFYGVTSAVGLVIQLTVASRVLARLGAVRSLLVTPVTTGLFAVATIVAPGFAPIVLLRASDRVLKGALFSSAMEQTQTPLPVVERAQARAFSRGVVAPIGYAIAALGLAALPAHFDLRVLSVLVLGSLVALLAVLGLRLPRTYVEALRRALDDRHLRLDPRAAEGGAPALDTEAAEVIARDLSSDDAGKAELAAELLAHTDPALAARLLPAGLLHPCASVRLLAIDGLVRTRGELPPALVELVTRDPVAEVRRGAVEALLATRTASPAATRALDAARSDPDPHVAALASVARTALAEPNGLDDGTALVGLLDPRRPIACVAALEALGPGAARAPAVVAALRALLRQGDDVELRLAALEAAARIGARSILPDVAPLLEDARTTAATVGHLLRWGEGALEAAAESVADSRAAGAGSPASAPISRLLAHPDLDVRQRVGSVLARVLGDGRSETLPRDVVRLLFEDEVRGGFSALSLLAGVAHDDGTPDWVVDEPFAFLGAEITLRFRAARTRLLCLLALFGGHRFAGAVEVGLRKSAAGGAPQVEAQIAELMEAVLPERIARTVVPLFDRLTLRERIRAAERVGMLDRAAMEDPLGWVVRNGDRTLRLCAIITYGARAAERFPAAYAEDSELIPVFERMRFLRSVPLLAELPGDELRRVAEVLHAEEHGAGAVVFRKGDEGEDMCVIVRGRVAIRHGDVELASLGPREFFGELSVLDHETRSADAVAVEPTELLRLRAADLGELMARRPQIQEKVMLVLVRRLRTRGGASGAPA